MSAIVRENTLGNVESTDNDVVSKVGYHKSMARHTTTTSAYWCKFFAVRPIYGL